MISRHHHPVSSKIVQILMRLRDWIRDYDEPRYEVSYSLIYLLSLNYFYHLKLLIFIRLYADTCNNTLSTSTGAQNLKLKIDKPNDKYDIYDTPSSNDDDRECVFAKL